MDDVKTQATVPDQARTKGGTDMAVTDEAISRIRGLIMSGQLAPGSKLPREQELAEQLGLSRNSMREAVKALVLARVLDVRRGDGTYVTSLEPRLLLEGMGLAVELMQDNTLVEMMEVRRLLEPSAAALAAIRIDEPTLTELHTHLERMRHAEGDAEELVVHDAAFHDCIAAATGNQSLISILKGVSAPTLRARTWRALIETNAQQLTITQHEEIYMALEARDAQLAHASALVHVTTSETRLRQALAS